MDHPAGQRPAECRPALVEVLRSPARRGPGWKYGRFLELVIGDGQLEPIAEDLQLLLGQLLGLVGDVARLDARARASSP